MHEIIVFRLVTQIVLEYTWKKTLDKTEAAIKNTQSEKLATLSTKDTKTKTSKKNRNTICVGHHYTQRNSNNVKKT